MYLRMKWGALRTVSYTHLDVYKRQATNFDCVTGNAYLGGLICPGVMSSLGALATRTAQLPRIALTAHADVPIVGRSTVTSLNHGFLFGFASMTEGLYARLTKTLEGPVAFVATGGFAPDVARVVDCFDLVRPDLVLEGLRLLWLCLLYTSRPTGRAGQRCRAKA